MHSLALLRRSHVVADWIWSMPLTSPSAAMRIPSPFTDMEALFTERADIFAPEGIDLDAVIKSVLQVARRHEVRVCDCSACAR